MDTNYKKVFGYLWAMFLVLMAYHAVLYFSYLKIGEETVFNNWIVVFIGLPMVYGAFFGLHSLFKHGLQGVNQKGLLFASLANLSFGFGFFTWAYYTIILNNDFPFPSYADYFWLFNELFNIFAFYYFFKLYRNSITKTKIVSAIVFILIGGYIISKFIGLPEWSIESGVSLDETFFNLFYSISDLLLLIISVVILTVSGGKIYRGLFVYNLAIICMIVGDLFFAYREENEIVWQGDISDVFFTIAGFLASLGIIMIVKDFQNRRLN